MCSFVRKKWTAYSVDDIAQHVLDIGITVTIEAWGEMPQDEQLKIIEIARTEMKKLLQSGLPSLYDEFFHRLPYNGNRIIYVTSTKEYGEIDGLLLCEQPPGFLDDA